MLIRRRSLLIGSAASVAGAGSSQAGFFHVAGRAPLPSSSQSITDITPHALGFTAGTGSAGTVIGTMVAVLSPTSPPGTGTFSLSGANAASFTIGSSSGVLSVGGSDLSAGTYNVNVIYTQAGLTGSPFTQAVVITGTAPGTTVNFVNSVTTFGNFGNFFPYYGTGAMGCTFTVGSSNIKIMALGRYRDASNSGMHTLFLMTSGTGTGTLADKTELIGSRVTLDLSSGSAGAFAYATLSTPIVLKAGLSYYLFCSEATGADSWWGYQTDYSGGIANVVTVTGGAAAFGGAWIQGSIDTPIGVQNEGTANRLFGPVDFKYQLTTDPPTSYLLGSPFPFLPRIYPGPQFQPPPVRVASGTITIDGNRYEMEPPLNSVTAQWIIDDNTGHTIRSPYIHGPQDTPFFGPNFPWLFDTTQLADGTHHAYLKFINSTSGNTYTSSYIMRSASMHLIVQNSGPKNYNVAQPIPVTTQEQPPGRRYNAVPNWIDYPGNPALPVTADPYPSPYAAPGANPTERLALRLLANWYVEDLTAVKTNEYESFQYLATTTAGGVYQDSIFPVEQGEAVLAYPAVVRKQPGLDGPRGDNRITPYSNFVAAPVTTFTGSISGTTLTATITTGRLQVNDMLRDAGTGVAIGTYIVSQLTGTTGLSGTYTVSKSQTVSSRTLTADPGFAGIELSGRLLMLHHNGAATTLAGWRVDRTKLQLGQAVAGGATEAAVFANEEFIGNITSSGLDTDQFAGANDLCYDPRDTTHRTIYFCGLIDHHIGKVDLSTSPPTITRYAGQPGTSGYRDGPSTEFSPGGTLGNSALFNEPFSIIMSDGTGGAGAAGTMYVADLQNGAIRVISPDGNTVTTLVGKQTGKPPVYPDPATIDTYSPAASTLFANAYITTPQVIKFTSAGLIVVLESGYACLRKIDIGAGTVTRIALPTGLSPGIQWFWMDVDNAAACGPVDDIMIVRAINNGPGTIWRVSLDGTTMNEIWETDPVGDLIEGPTNATSGVFDATGGYSWVIAMSRTQARFVTGGFRRLGIVSWRKALSSDPDPNGTITDQALYGKGLYIWQNGTCLGFPWGSRPSIIALHGQRGFAQHGPFGKTVDEIARLYPLDTTTGNYTQAVETDSTKLAYYIQHGMDGVVPCPEITGNDLRALCYYIRRRSMSGTYPTVATPGPLNTDATPPMISNVSAMRIGSGESGILRVTWDTDKPTIGMAVAGSAAEAAGADGVPYPCWSPIETVFATTGHSADIPSLPLVSPIHFSVYVKDIAGNGRYAVDGTVT